MRFVRSFALIVALASACTFQTRELTCEGDDAALCGAGEGCDVRDSAIVCTCGSATASARVCASGTTCSNGACVDNGSPIAVIRSVRNDGTLRVARDSRVTLSGADSNDPEGGTVTYAWSFADNCGLSTALLDLTAAELSFDTDGMTDGCIVTLTVTDSLGESSSATARLSLRDVGAYVSARAVCIDTYDDNSDEPQGTYDAPFCSVEQAIAAAIANNIAEVSVAAEAFTVAATVEVPSAMAIVGGYLVDFTAPWVSSGERSSFRTTAASDPVFRLAQSGTTRLTGLSVGRTRYCTAACTVIEVTGTQAFFENVIVDAIVENETMPVEDAVSGVYVHAFADDPTTSLTAHGVQIAAPAGESMAALRVDGPITVVLEDVDLSAIGGTVRTVALRTLNGVSLTMTRGSLTAETPANNVNAYAIADGTNGLITEACPTLGESCAGSLSIALHETTMIARSPTIARGVAAAGTTLLQINGVEIDVHATRAEGVRLLDVADARITDVDVEAVGEISENDGYEDYAIGLYDGFSNGTGDAFSNGSARLSVSGGIFIATMGEGEIGESLSTLSAMLLKNTAAGKIENVSIFTQGTLGNTARAELLSAVNTQATTGLVFEGNTIRTDMAVGTERTSAFADGRSEADISGINAAASSDLEIRDNVITGNLTGTGEAVKRSVIVLAGTKSASVTENTVRIIPDIAEISGNVFYEAGIWSLLTHDIIAEENSIAFDPSVGALAGAGSTYIIGWLDGAYPDVSSNTQLASAASLSLAVNRLTVVLPTLGVMRTIGAFFRGNQTSTPAKLFNSFIDVSSSLEDIGVIVDRASVRVLHNTIRFGRCVATGCSGTGVGIMMIQSAGREVDLSGNVLTVESRANSADSVPMLLDVESSPSTVGFKHFDYNGWGGSGMGTGEAHTLYWVYNNSTTEIISPAEAGGGLSQATLTARLGANGTITGSVQGDSVFCPDQIRLDPAGVGNGLASMRSEPALASDYDGRTRLSPFDMGANERGTCPYP